MLLGIEGADEEVGLGGGVLAGDASALVDDMCNNPRRTEYSGLEQSLFVVADSMFPGLIG